MTLNEFKAWLEGFEESLNGYAPDRDQWKKIKARIDQITAVPAIPAPSKHPVEGQRFRPLFNPTRLEPIEGVDEAARQVGA